MESRKREKLRPKKKCIYNDGIYYQHNFRETVIWFCLQLWIAYFARRWFDCEWLGRRGYGLHPLSIRRRWDVAITDKENHKWFDLWVESVVFEYHYDDKYWIISINVKCFFVAMQCLRRSFSSLAGRSKTMSKSSDSLNKCPLSSQTQRCRSIFGVKVYAQHVFNFYRSKH